MDTVTKFVKFIRLQYSFGLAVFSFYQRELQIRYPSSRTVVELFVYQKDSLSTARPERLDKYRRKIAKHQVQLSKTDPVNQS